MRFFEDIEIGARREVGSFTFTADDIKRFATQFDPQRFHLDEEEGRKSLFGGPAASGWRQRLPRAVRKSRWEGLRRASVNCAGSSRFWPATPSIIPAGSKPG